MIRLNSVLCLLSSVLWLLALAVPAPAQRRPDAENMKLLGFNDLQGRSAAAAVIHQQNGRWLAYIGHDGGKDADDRPRDPLTRRREANGTSILDVTDPRHPRYLHHIPGSTGAGDAGGAQSVNVCDGKTLPKANPAKTYLLRSFGDSAHELWDVSSPLKPELLLRIEGVEATGANWWECDTGVAYLVSSAPGWRSKHMTTIYDFGNPEHGVYVRNFGLEGQQPGARGTAPPGVAGIFSTGPDGKRVYFGFGRDRDGIIAIADRAKLLTGSKEPLPQNLAAPLLGRLELSALTGAASVLPLPPIKVAEFADDIDATRQFVVVAGEERASECQEPRQLALIVDVTSEARPMAVASYTPTEVSGDFCTRGGRFGIQSQNLAMTQAFDGKLLFFAAGNAGVRVVDIRDPYHPIEVAHYIPAVTPRSEASCADVEGNKHCVKVTETGHVTVDPRGYVYITDAAGNGLHILALTGEAKRIPEFSR
jgi:hypothetical protein